MLLLANVDADGNWFLGIGDPTLFGWIITFAYFVGLFLCARAWKRERETCRRGGRGLHPRFWFVMAAAMLVLGINKQLDLQTLMTFIGRRMAKSEGWYGKRRAVQIAFIVLVGLMACGVIGAGWWWIRESWRRYWMAAAGVAYLSVFIVLRAASFHHLDAILYRLPVVGLFVNRALELGGIVLIGWGAGKVEMAKSAKDQSTK